MSSHCCTAGSAATSPPAGPSGFTTRRKSFVEKGKFVEAGELFAQVRALYGGLGAPARGKGAKAEGVSGSEWGHAAGFRIGQCYLGLNRPSQAIDWWQKFIKESPTGPWRGQSQVAIVDLALQSELNLKKATEHARAAANALANRRDKTVGNKAAVSSRGVSKGRPASPAPEADPSWKEAAYDIYLRQGIVSLIASRFDVAAEAFQQARQSAPGGMSHEIQVGLDRLIESSKRRAKVIPNELGVGDDRAAVAVALGNIYSILRQYDVAKGYFSLPLGGQWRSRSAAHRSFAGLGLARILDSTIARERAATNAEGRKGKDRPVGTSSGERTASRSPSPSLSIPGPSTQVSARALYEASLKEYPNGSWHDETLFCLGTMIQDEADVKFAELVLGAGESHNRGELAKPRSPQVRAAEAKAEKERFLAWLKAKGEAVPYWQRLLDCHPQSPYCEQALYYMGAVLYELAVAAPGDKAEQMAKDADAMFNRLCEKHPTSVYAGDACVRQIDFALEQKFDLNRAAALLDQGLQWAKNRNVKIATAADGTLTKGAVAEADKAVKEGAIAGSAWQQRGERPAPELLNNLYNLYLRAGVLAYLQERYDEADKYLDAGGPARPTQGMQANFDLQKIGLFILQECAKRKEPAWHPDAIAAAKTDSQKLALRLADTYLHGQRPDKAEKIYKKLLSGDSSLGRPSPAVEGYCLMQLGLVLSKKKVNPAQSIECYRLFLKKGYADLPWAADALHAIDCPPLQRQPRSSSGHRRVPVHYCEVSATPGGRAHDVFPRPRRRPIG